MTDTQTIVVEDIVPHAPDIIWKALTTGDLLDRWLMPAAGFEAVEGNRFTFATKPAGAWDGTIRCEVLEVVPHSRLVYSWKSGDKAMSVTARRWTRSSAGQLSPPGPVHASGWNMQALSCQETRAL